MTAPPPRLFQFRVSHYNEKVRWALDYKRWPHVRTTLVLGFHILAIRRRTGQNKVPVLELDDQTLIDSTTIIAEIERRRPEPALYPADETERRRALEIEDFFDEEVAPDLRRLCWATYFDSASAAARMSTDGRSALVRSVFRALWPVLKIGFRQNMKITQEHVERSHERLSGHFDRLESEIGESGYLVGDQFTVADLAAAAVMSALLRPPQFSYPLPEPWPPALVDLRESIIERPGSRWVFDMFERHRGPSSEIHAD